MIVNGISLAILLHTFWSSSLTRSVSGGQLNTEQVTTSTFLLNEFEVYPSVKFHQRGIVISHTIHLSVHGYQSRASKNYPIFMKFGTHMYNGCEKTPIDSVLILFN